MCVLNLNLMFYQSLYIIRKKILNEDGVLAYALYIYRENILLEYCEKHSCGRQIKYTIMRLLYTYNTNQNITGFFF